MTDKARFGRNARLSWVLGVCRYFCSIIEQLPRTDHFQMVYLAKCQGNRIQFTQAKVTLKIF